MPIDVGADRALLSTARVIAGTPRLMEWIKMLHFYISRYLILYPAGMEYQAHSQTEHRQILAACRMGHIEAAAEPYLKQHLQSASKRLAEYLSQMEPQNHIRGG